MPPRLPCRQSDTNPWSVSVRGSASREAPGQGLARNGKAGHCHCDYWLRFSGLREAGRLLPFPLRTVKMGKLRPREDRQAPRSPRLRRVAPWPCVGVQGPATASLTQGGRTAAPQPPALSPSPGANQRGAPCRVRDWRRGGGATHQSHPLREGPRAGQQRKGVRAGGASSAPPAPRFFQPGRGQGTQLGMLLRSSGTGAAGRPSQMEFGKTYVHLSLGQNVSSSPSRSPVSA